MKKIMEIMGTIIAIFGIIIIFGAVGYSEIVPSASIGATIDDLLIKSLIGAVVITTGILMAKEPSRRPQRQLNMPRTKRFPLSWLWRF